MNLDSLINLLNRWDLWRRIAATPDRVDRLEAAVASLEARLQAAGDGKRICGECGAAAIEVTVTEEDYGIDGRIQRIHRTCSSCGTREIKDGAVIRKPTIQIETARPHNPFDDI